MNLSSLRERVYSELTEEENRYFSDTEIDRWLNIAQNKITIKVEHLKETSYLETDGSEKYELPNDFIREFEVKLEDDFLDQIGMEEADDTYSQYYYIWEDDLYLTEDSTGENLYIYYYKLPEEMEEDTDTPDIPIEYQDLLVIHAVYKAKQKDDKYEQAEFHKRDFREGLNDMLKNYTRSPMNSQWEVERI